MIDSADLDKRFTYHPVKTDGPWPQDARYVEMRQRARDLAEFVNRATPDSREKLLAITHLEEAVMWANAAIARNE